MHHYAVVKRDVPDLNLDGKVNATDATTGEQHGHFADEHGHGDRGADGTFYLAGNWEKGDRDGNGFVNQADADWLAGRYTTLGVNLPDRCRTPVRSRISRMRRHHRRWRGGRDAQNKLVETGNFTQRRPVFCRGAARARRNQAEQLLCHDSQSERAETTAGVNSLHARCRPT